MLKSLEQLQKNALLFYMQRIIWRKTNNTAKHRARLYEMGTKSRS